jgi:hypothetical protein
MPKQSVLKGPAEKNEAWEVIYGSVETLKKHSVAVQKVDEKPQNGGQGDAPPGMPPPLGERGGHIPDSHWKIRKKGFQYT